MYYCFFFQLCGQKNSRTKLPGWCRESSHSLSSNIVLTEWFCYWASKSLFIMPDLEKNPIMWPKRLLSTIQTAAIQLPSESTLDLDAPHYFSQNLNTSKWTIIWEKADPSHKDKDTLHLYIVFFILFILFFFFTHCNPWPKKTLHTPWPRVWPHALLLVPHMVVFSYQGLFSAAAASCTGRPSSTRAELKAMMCFTVEENTGSDLRIKKLFKRCQLRLWVSCLIAISKFLCHSSCLPLSRPI